MLWLYFYKIIFLPFLWNIDTTDKSVYEESSYITYVPQRSAASILFLDLSSFRSKSQCVKQISANQIALFQSRVRVMLLWNLYTFAYTNVANE